MNSLTDNFDKRNGGKQPPRSNDQQDADIRMYQSGGEPRNICFVQTSGEQFVLYYADLMRQAHDPNEDVITLTFRTETVTLKGHLLPQLFDALKAHNVKEIRCVDKRYEATKEEKEIVVTEIVITKTN